MINCHYITVHFISSDFDKDTTMKGAAVFLAAILAVSALPNELQCPEDQLQNWEQEQLLVHPDCGKFYKCTFGEAVSLDCPAGLFFNLESWECDWKQNVDCGERNNPDEVKEPKPESSEEVTTPAPESSEEATTPAPGSSEEATTLAPESSEEATPESSEEDTKSAPESSEEDTKPASESSEEVTKPAPKSSEEDTKPTPESSEEQNEGDSDSLANGCPVNPHVHRLLPHENNCNLFYYCVWGDKVLRECPAALFFNPANQVCDWPQNSGCVQHEEVPAGRLSANKHLEARRQYMN